MAAQPLANLTPAQRRILEEPPAPPIDTSFSFDSPAGPQFSDEEMKEQLARGKTFLPTIMQAFKSGEDSVQIPIGDYRFAQADTPLAIGGISAPPDRPFVIDATGVTLWFDLKDAQIPAGQNAFRISRCSNVVFKGATLDRGRGRGNIEGRITAIDRANNRFEIQPTPGSLPPTAPLRSSFELRIIPFKHDGRLCAPLYDLQGGNRKLRYAGIAPSEEEPGRYWITMLDTDLMDRIHDEAWIAQQGELGVLRVGDGISCVYTGCQAITIAKSANVTLLGVKCHLTKGGGAEGGGDGGHLWKDCYFGGRPGTCHWQGGDGYMFMSTRYGTTLANVTICRTTDDVANFHGFWGRVDTVDPTTNTVTLRPKPELRSPLENARCGDTWRFFNGQQGVVVGTATLIAVKGQLSFEMELAEGGGCASSLTDFVGLMVDFPTNQCAGWAMVGCRLEDCFQRVLVISGPGLIRDCAFARIGCGISLNTAMGNVGGFACGVTVERNTFEQVAQRPRAAVIDAHGHCLKKDGVPAIQGLVIAHNRFLLSSWPAIRLVGVLGARIEGNTFMREDVDGNGDIHADDVYAEGGVHGAIACGDTACGEGHEGHGRVGSHGDGQHQSSSGSSSGEDACHVAKGVRQHRGGAEAKAIGRGGGCEGGSAAPAVAEGTCEPEDAAAYDLDGDAAAAAGAAEADADAGADAAPLATGGSTHPIVLKFAKETAMHRNDLHAPEHVCTTHPVSASTLVAVMRRCTGNTLDGNPLPDVK